VVLLELVPGTLFLKTLDSDRHLAIPVDFVEVVPGTDGCIWYRWLYLVPMVTGSFDG